MKVNQRILDTVHDIYVEDDIGMNLTPPVKKASVMLLGNHSAGKSSYINWYVEQVIQKTSVAIETQTFTFITQASSRKSLKGKATLEMFPELQSFAALDGVMQNLSTETCNSNSRKFNMINFIDTPGLVDGDMNYPFDPEKCLVELAESTNVIFVFFDPIGQALCSRTMRIVEKLHEKYPEKMRFFLSKADTVPDETDRQRVLIQITQNLTSKLKNKHFELLPIYLPTDKTVPVRNHIEQSCDEIDKAINLNVQNSLNTLELDCKKLVHKIDELLQTNERHIKANFNATIRAAIISLIYSSLIIVLAFFQGYPLIVKKLPLEVKIYATPVYKAIKPLMPPMTKENIIIFSVLMLALYIIRKTTCRHSLTLPRKELNYLNESREVVSKQVMSIKRELYEEYFKQSIESFDT